MIYFHQVRITLILFFCLICIQTQAGHVEAWIAMERGQYTDALKHYKQLATMGDPVAQAQLSSMLFLGDGIPKNIEEAQRLANIARPQLELLAEAGDSRAQVVLGSLYRDGRGVSKDEQKAMTWYRRASEKGSATAQVSIASMYLNGIGVSRNLQQVEAWVRMAAEQGHARAQATLGVMLANGEGVAKNEQQAVTWLRKSAEQGFAKAQSALGAMYLTGRGLSKDDQQAVTWFRKAAEQEDAFGQHSLAYMYLNGRGVPKDVQQAFNWYFKAAVQGDAGAQNDLGVSYSTGRGVPKDEKYAYFWWLIASAQGNPQAVSNRDSAEKRLGPDQIAAAQTAARSWKPGMAPIMETIPQPLPERVGPNNHTAPSAPRTLSRTTPESTGSGFAVAPNQLITNAHVVEGCLRVSLSGRGTATVLAMDKSNDLALLQTDRLPVFASFRAERLRQGDPIAVVGFPLAGILASGAQVTSGNVSALAGLQNNSSFIQISAPVQPGNSGGPLLDTAGSVTGVVVSKLNATKIAELTGDIPQNINFAVSPLILRGFLDANNVQYQIQSTNRTLSIADVTDLARKFTYLVQCWR